MKRQELLAHIGKRIRELRISAQFTQAQLAERAGISNEFLSKIECGRTAPSVVTIQRMAEALGVSVDELFRDVQGTDAVDSASARYVLAEFLQEAGPEGRELLMRLAQLVRRLVDAKRSG